MQITLAQLRHERSNKAINKQVGYFNHGVVILVAAN